MILTLLFSAPGVAQAQTPVTETPQAAIQPPTPAEIIDAINALRLSYGLPPLSVHPILMSLAQRQADGIAAGLTGHWRPYGLTLGQLLIMRPVDQQHFVLERLQPRQRIGAEDHVAQRPRIGVPVVQEGIPGNEGRHVAHDAGRNGYE